MGRLARRDSPAANGTADGADCHACVARARELPLVSFFPVGDIEGRSPCTRETACAPHAGLCSAPSLPKRGSPRSGEGDRRSPTH